MQTILNTMKFIACTICFCLLLLSVPLPAISAVPQSGYIKKESAYFRKPSGYWRKADQGPTTVLGRLGSGLNDLLLGWTDFVTEPVKAVQNGENAGTAAVRGVGSGIVRTLRGAVQTVAAPFTTID